MRRPVQGGKTVSGLDFGRLSERIRDEIRQFLSRHEKGGVTWTDVEAFVRKHWLALVTGGVALAVISYLVTKSGLAASIVNKMRWRCFTDEEIDPPPPGTPLLEALGPGGIVEHSGLYLGESAVAELHGDGVFKKVTLSRFLNGDESDPDNPRCGTKIFAACDLETRKPLALESAVTFASCRIDETTEYNLLANNCHRFTASCLLGELLEPLRLSELILQGAYSIARLEEVIVNRVNGGRDICWLSVRRDVPSFDFVVSPEKRREA